MAEHDHPTARALRASRRDPEAFAAVYEREVDAVLRFLALRTYDPQVALDLVAETFAQAYRARRRFRGSTDPEAGAWLYAIARAELSRFYRRGFAERRAVERLGWSLPAWTDEDLEAVDRRVDQAARRRLLGDALEELSPGVRAAVRLRVVDELDHAEVARRLGVNEEAARARVSRGLRALAATDETPKTGGAR